MGIKCEYIPPIFIDECESYRNRETIVEIKDNQVFENGRTIGIVKHIVMLNGRTRIQFTMVSKDIETNGVTRIIYI